MTSLVLLDLNRAATTEELFIESVCNELANRMFRFPSLKNQTAAYYFL